MGGNAENAMILELFRKWKETGDDSFREKIAEANDLLVKKIASKFIGKAFLFDDLVQVGYMGLMGAIDRFDPNRGIKFSTYAVPTIRGEIQRYFRNHFWLLKVPRDLQEANYKVIKAIDKLWSFLGRDPTVTEIAESIDMPEELVNQSLLLRDLEYISLDKVIFDHNVPSGSVSEIVGAEDPGIQQIFAQADNKCFYLEQAIKELDPLSEQIIRLRFYENLSQTETGKRLGIYQVKVFRLQERALKVLSSILLDKTKDTERV